MAPGGANRNKKRRPFAAGCVKGSLDGQACRLEILDFDGSRGWSQCPLPYGGTYPRRFRGVPSCGSGLTAWKVLP